jgi:hypothetical protein
MTTLDKIKAFTRSASTELLIATLTRIEVEAETKTLRNGEEVKDFSREQRIARAAIYNVIEEQEGVELVEVLLESFELQPA